MSRYAQKMSDRTYAVASGVPGIYGLYATIVPLLAYALFGPSRILVLGPDSALVAIILGVVSSLSEGDTLRAVALAGMMAVVSGVVCLLAGVPTGHRIETIFAAAQNVCFWHKADTGRFIGELSN